MTPTEKEERIAELRAQHAELKSVIADLAALDITAEVGSKPTWESVEAASRKLEAIKVRGETAKGGGKLSRTETVTVRLDPKLRYLAELAARLHRRTLSSYIEWSIEASLGNNLLTTGPHGPSIKDESEYLWDVDEADRFAKLALRYPHLLTHEEQVRWKLIRECGYLWKGSHAGRRKEWTWAVDEDSFIFQRLREHWIAFCGVADTGSGHHSLPTWQKTEPISRPPPLSKTGFDDIDDEIQF